MSGIVPPSRPFQLVIWGASGYTGKILCKQLAQEYQGEVKWALAGRNRAKLEAFKEELIKINPECVNVPIIEANIDDQKSVDKMVKQAKVVVALAGPFARFGTPVVDASVRLGTHYCDICGELPWIKKSVESYHEKAKAKKTKIVHACGFDSVPSDLGAYMVVDFMLKNLKKHCGKLDMFVTKFKSTPSGGSISTAIDLFEMPAHEFELCKDPYCLDQAGSVRGKDTGDQWGVGYNRLAACWTYPYRFSMVNTRIVRRTNCLTGQKYGQNFRYNEAVQAEGPIDAFMGALGTAALGFFGLIRPFRNAVRNQLPKLGEGPPEQISSKGSWSYRFVGFTDAEEGEKPIRVEAVARSKKEPSNQETARIVLEAGICLALQQEELNEQGYQSGGVLTPATAMGGILLQRLRNKGVVFEITKPNSQKQTTRPRAPL
eukprot:TRINITY_DN5640_c0_g1_i13.p1 TRINITY_DN5640_c0_g1~~TRINITY_DN5640_c0_g1_i13.p1  ORF type:complete len:431 (-),score=68.30 TRINITY_DN5640_c0_g1_i13:35-1327(-)